MRPIPNLQYERLNPCLIPHLCGDRKSKEKVFTLKSYGDGSGDLTHYVTDKVVNDLNHNRNILGKMKDVVYKYRYGEITESEMDMEIKRLHEQYV